MLTCYDSDGGVGCFDENRYGGNTACGQKTFVKTRSANIDTIIRTMRKV